MNAVLAFISALAALGTFLLELSDRFEFKRRTRTLPGDGKDKSPKRDLD